MNPELPNHSREKMEQRLTALLLGELSAEEAAAMRRAMEQDAGLAALHERLKLTVGLVREVAAHPVEAIPVQGVPLKLSRERREKLLAHFKTVALQEFRPEKRASKFRLVELAAIILILGVFAAMLFPALSKSKSKGSVATAVNLGKARLAADAALESAPAEMAAEPTAVEFAPQIQDERRARERLGFGINHTESSLPGVPGSPSVAEEFSKRPVAVTPVGSRPAAPIALPQTATVGNQWGVNGHESDGDAVSLDGNSSQSLAFYRNASDFGGRGGGGAAPRGNAQPLARREIRLNYASPDNVATAVRGVMEDGRSEVTVQNSSGSLSVLGPLGELQKAEELGRKLDVPTRQRLVESKVDQTKTYDASERPPISGVAIDPATGRPVVNAGELTAAPEQQLETRTFTVQPDAFYGGSKRDDGLALNEPSESAKSPTASDGNRYTIPRVAVTGIASGGGGGGGGMGGGGLPAIVATNSVAGFETKAGDWYSRFGRDSKLQAGKAMAANDQSGNPPVSVTADELEQVGRRNEALGAPMPEVNIGARFAETAQKENRALGYDWYFGSKQLNERGELERSGAAQAGQSASTLALGGAVVTSSGRSSDKNKDNVSVLRDLPVADRFAGRIDQNGIVSTSPTVSDAERSYTNHGYYSLDVVGYSGMSSKPAAAFSLADNGAARRQPSTIVLPGAPPVATPRLSQASSDKNQPAADSLVSGGIRSREGLLAKAENTNRQTQDSQVGAEKNQLYVKKQRELQDEMDVRRLLTRKINIEKTDLSLPKSSSVEIVESADAKTAPSQTALGAIQSAVSGKVERFARLKVEPDKSDIAELSAVGRLSSHYDPYFIQTEFEAIKSESVLSNVVGALKLDEAWARQGGGAKLKPNEAIAMLRERLDIQSVPNTTMVDIRAKSANPAEAAKIANAVAAFYKQQRLAQGEALVRGGIKELDQQMTRQDEKIDRVKAELDQLRRELKISDAEGAAEVDVASVRRMATNAPIPQPEILTHENNFSTFSLNVSDVSFKLAAASLEQGQMPDAASVRSEEFINAFDYRDPEPAAGAPIAFAWERARYSFAHNRDLLRFSLKTAAAGRQAGRPLNIVLLLDNSGSMERADRVRTIHEALRVLAAQLQPQDKLSVITFARTARLVVDGASGSEAEAVALAVSEITPQGGTNLEDAMALAYQTAAKHYLANGINRVVLLTDGAANLGDVEPDSLKQKVEAQRQQGIALDCFGIGWDGLNDDLLEVLSRNGDGRYGFINSPEEAATDFVGQLAGALKVAASDVKVQVEFNPKRVTSYRQIGYAKHQLTKEQFRDNTVDAAEIAAQEAGNALYTVELNPGGVGPIGTVRVRYKVPGTTTYREQSWDVPYTGTALTLEQSTPGLRLAASASAFAEWLVASPFAGEVTPDALLNQLRGVPEVFGADSRPRKLEWMIRQAKSLSGN
jgi:Mg-chelatase subunit ChlD